MQQVLRKLRSVRTRIRAALLLRGVLVVLAGAAAILAGSFVLDWTLRPPLGVRVVLLATMAGAVTILAARALLVPLVRKLPLRTVALLVEKRHPEYGDELISAIELDAARRDGTTTESPALIEAMVARASERFRGESFGGIARFGATRTPALILAGLLVLCVWYAGAHPVNARVWRDRILLLRDVAWPRATTLHLEIADMDAFHPRVEDGGARVVLHVPRDTTLRVRARAEGTIPDAAVLRRRPMATGGVRGAAVEIPMSPRDGTEGGVHFEATIPPVTSSFELTAAGGDDTDDEPVFEIDVRSAPAVDRFMARYRPPPYTGRPDEDVAEGWNIRAPAGTEVTMEFETSLPLSSFRLLLRAGGPRELSAADASRRRFVHTFTVLENDFWEYALLGENGVENRDRPQFEIIAEVDARPRIAVDLPQQGRLECTPFATVPLRLSVSDDYGVSALSLRLGLEPAEVLPIAMPFEPEDLTEPLPSKNVSAFRALALAELALPRSEGAARPPEVGESLYLRFEAQDNRSFGDRLPQSETTRTAWEIRIVDREEVERSLVQLQSRIKEDVKETERRLDRAGEALTEALGAVSADGSAVEEMAAAVRRAEERQIAVSRLLNDAQKSCIRLFDTWAWNRLDRSNLTEKIVGHLAAGFRAAVSLRDVAPLYAAVHARVRGEASETQPMGRLTVILGLFLQTTVDLCPELERTLRRAVEARDRAEAATQLRAARARADDLRAAIATLRQKLEAWEDFQDIVQSWKEIREYLEGLHNRTRTAVSQPR